ncbi:MAG: hypothetical protein NT069_26800 [Planctomycetota bacterium]|nr:hypothetical protein [Planctomycetota bacterium]
MPLPDFQGRWIYRSFRPREGAPSRPDPKNPTGPSLPPRPADLVANWAESATLDVTTDSAGAVSGTLTIIPGQLVLKVTGHVTPGDGGRILPGIQLIGEVGNSKNTIRGYFIPDTNVIVGTVLATQGDPALAPDGTAGPFVLVKQ